MAESSDFKLGMQVGLHKAHHKITPIPASERGSRLVELSKIRDREFPFNISAMAEARLQIWQEAGICQSP